MDWTGKQREFYRMELALVLMHFGSPCQRHRKRELLALKCNAICDGVNVGDAFRQVERLVMVSGWESA